MSNDNDDGTWNGTRLRAQIKERGVKQIWLAKRCGVSETTLSRWVQGHTQPPAMSLAKLATVLGCKIRALLPEGA